MKIVEYLTKIFAFKFEKKDNIISFDLGIGWIVLAIIFLIWI